MTHVRDLASDDLLNTSAHANWNGPDVAAKQRGGNGKRDSMAHIKK